MRQSNSILIVLGLAFFWPTFRRDSIGFIFGDNIGDIYEARGVYFLFLVFVISIAVLIIWKWRKFDQLLDDAPFLVPIIALLASVGSLMLIYASYLGVFKPFSEILGALFYAIWFAVIVPSWGKVMERTVGFESFLPVVISFIISYGLSSLCLVSEYLLYFMPFCGPLGSGILWYFCFTSGKKKQRAKEKAVNFKDIPLKRIALLTLFLLAGGLVRGFLNKGIIGTTPSVDLLVTHAISIFVAIIIIALVNTQRTPSALYKRAWTVLAIVLFAGLFVVAIVGDQAALMSFGRSITIAARTCFSLLLWLVLSLVVAQKPFPAVVLFSLFYTVGEAIASLSSYLLVPAFVQFLGASFTEHLLVFSLAMAFMLLVASLIFLGSDLFQSGEVRLDESPEVLHEKVCKKISGEYGLSEREEEILRLISLGHSQKKIAALLYLSPSTIQSYSKTVYKKLNVHKRQDVIDLVASQKI